MTTDVRAMWRDLNLDLDAHDALMSFLGSAFTRLFLERSGRPGAMAYFDGFMGEVHGRRVAELLEDRRKGGAVVGAFCTFVPEEVVRACGGTLVGLCSGADFAVAQVESHLPRTTCALIKSALGFKLGRVCPYMEAADLIVGENTCDGKKKSYEVWKDLGTNVFVMDLPQVKSPEGRSLYRFEILSLAERVGAITGRRLDAGALREACSVVNAKRRALHRLEGLRGSRPTPIAGLDALLVNQIAFLDDTERFTAAVNALCDELDERVRSGRGAAPAEAPRILVSGCPQALPNWKLHAIVEGAGAVVVGEESCVGARGVQGLVDTSDGSLDDLVDAVADRYMTIDCAVFTPNPSRLDHVRTMREATSADGVIHYALQFCQPYQIEAGPVERKLESEGIPSLRVDTDYSMEDAGQLTTRVEAFLERLTR